MPEPTDSPLPAGTTVSSSGESDRPDNKHPSYGRMQNRWRTCRDLMGGTEKVREGRERYLPMLAREATSAYEARLKLVALFNGFARTVKACVGLILEKEPTLGDDMPDELTVLWENIDNADTHGKVFTWQLAMDALIDGHSGIFVDMRRAPGNRSIADDAALNIRPYWVLVRAEDIYMALYSTVNGRRVLSLLVLRSNVEIPDGDFGVKTVTQFRVYRHIDKIVTSEIWELSSDDTAKAPTRKEGPFQMLNILQIPFAPCIAGEKVGPLETRPPLIDLADLNIEHHRVKTDIANIQTLACVPTIKRKGYIAPIGEDGKPNPEPVVLGPSEVMDVPIEGDISFFSPDVTVLEPAMKTLQDIKADMGAAGLAFLSPDKRAAETAEAKRIDAAAQNATLAAFGHNLQDCLETAFMYTGQFLKKKSGSVNLDLDFAKRLRDSGTVDILEGLKSKGLLSLETLLTAVRDSGILPSLDVQEEMRRIRSEGVLPDERGKDGE